MSERSFFPSVRAGVIAGLAVAALLAVVPAWRSAQVTGSSQTTTDAQGQQHESVTLTAPLNKKDKKDKVVQSKDTKRELRKEKKLTPRSARTRSCPTSPLRQGAQDAIKHGRFDVAASISRPC